MATNDSSTEQDEAQHRALSSDTQDERQAARRPEGERGSELTLADLRSDTPSTGPAWAW